MTDHTPHGPDADPHGPDADPREPDTDPHDLAAAYALDALDPDERRAFETHLQDCAACRTEVAELREAAAGLSEGLESAPPAALRTRVLAQVAAEAGAAADASGRTPDHDTERDTDRDPDRGRRESSDLRRRASGHRWWLAAAAAVLVGTGAWGASQLLGGEDAATLIVQAQDAQEHEADTAEGEVTVITSAAQDAAVIRLPQDLEPPPQGQVYQAWFVGADGSARSAGLLTQDALEGDEVVLEGSPAEAAAVGLTVEPEGGSDQPTTEPFAVVPLG